MTRVQQFSTGLCARSRYQAAFRLFHALSYLHLRLRWVRRSLRETSWADGTPRVPIGMHGCQDSQHADFCPQCSKTSGADDNIAETELLRELDEFLQTFPLTDEAKSALVRAMKHDSPLRQLHWFTSLILSLIHKSCRTLKPIRKCFHRQSQPKIKVLPLGLMLRVARC